MKKLLSLSFVFVLFAAFTFGGCSEEEIINNLLNDNTSLFTITITPASLDQNTLTDISITGININDNCDVFRSNSATCEDDSTADIPTSADWTTQGGLTITDSPDLGEEGMIDFSHDAGTNACVCWVVRCTTTFGTFWSNIVKRTVNP